MILELYLEVSYFLSQIFVMITVTEVTFKLYQVPHLKVTVILTKFLFKSNFPIPANMLEIPGNLRETKVVSYSVIQYRKSLGICAIWESPKYTYYSWS